MPNLEEELQQCLPDLWRYAFSLTRSRDQADDLVQDCAERALRKSDLFDGRAAKPWLMRILLNIYRSQLRAPTRRYASSLDDMPHDPAAPDGTDRRMELNDTARALASLPEEQREALLAVVTGGLSYKDAAASLDIPLGTLMSRIARARAALRAQTGEDA